MLKIRIIGCGCDSCEMLGKNMISATERLGVEFKYSKVCDYATKMTPILFIDDKMISVGKVLSVDELVDKLQSLMKQME